MAPALFALLIHVWLFFFFFFKMKNAPWPNRIAKCLQFSFENDSSVNIKATARENKVYCRGLEHESVKTAYYGRKENII